MTRHSGWFPIGGRIGDKWQKLMIHSDDKTNRFKAVAFFSLPTDRQTDFSWFDRQTCVICSRDGKLQSNDFHKLKNKQTLTLESCSRCILKHPSTKITLPLQSRKLDKTKNYLQTRHVSRFLQQWRCVASMHVFPRWDFKVSSVVPCLTLLHPSNTRFQLKREGATIKYLPKILPFLASLCTRVPTKR